MALAQERIPKWHLRAHSAQDRSRAASSQAEGLASSFTHALFHSTPQTWCSLPSSYSNKGLEK